jgi:hypothetical protein
VGGGTLGHFRNLTLTIEANVALVQRRSVNRVELIAGPLRPTTFIRTRGTPLSFHGFASNVNAG